MILIDSVSFSYPNSSGPAVNKLFLKIAEKSRVLISGPGGSGKTTFCKLLKGLIRPSCGHVVFNSPICFAAVAYLSGDPYDSFVGASVEEDIVFGMENQGVAREEMAKRLHLALESTGLQGMEDRLVHTLSGGEQQKLALAGALAAGARILILDEALNMLDRPLRTQIRSLLQKLQEDPGLTIIEVTHDLEIATGADKIVFFSGGSIIFDGSYSDFSSFASGRTWREWSDNLELLKQELYIRDIHVQDCTSNSRLSECFTRVEKK
ncbi:energy-coupling factor ABC transporter ATP-binding protein [Desulfomonile tiedjei]|uniref:ABC-type cobalt transport system, ATPase component n=1 Tax=Desulfomonile tiedjei (strain ATCC 49306 / DSM 6799 / DCB-1) TaxID=706587 RepID=I4CE89_DESTA|nr:energy-coupling factor ABC transporter ATP-binding protein [Desulfomonile tiedjei]AFM27880.1 ABC-type cobalt transport system, ATPase component [Desulfomonile tiedjei DSM 6799]